MCLSSVTDKTVDFKVTRIRTLIRRVISTLQKLRSFEDLLPVWGLKFSTRWRQQGLLSPGTNVVKCFAVIDGAENTGNIDSWQFFTK